LNFWRESKSEAMKSNPVKANKCIRDMSVDRMEARFGYVPERWQKSQWRVEDGTHVYDLRYEI